jgi:hypothetical protein
LDARCAQFSSDEISFLLFDYKSPTVGWSVENIRRAIEKETGTEQSRGRWTGKFHVNAEPKKRNAQFLPGTMDEINVTLLAGQHHHHVYHQLLFDLIVFISFYHYCCIDTVN